MHAHISLSISFSRKLSENEQATFWLEITRLMEQLGCSAGGGNSPEHLDWIIDCQEATINKEEVIDHLIDFLYKNQELIGKLAIV